MTLIGAQMRILDGRSATNVEAVVMLAGEHHVTGAPVSLNKSAHAAGFHNRVVGV